MKVPKLKKGEDAPSRTQQRRVAAQKGEPVPRFDAPDVCEWRKGRVDGLWWSYCGEPYIEFENRETCPGCGKQVKVRGEK